MWGVARHTSFATAVRRSPSRAGTGRTPRKASHSRRILCHARFHKMHIARLRRDDEPTTRRLPMRTRLYTGLPPRPFRRNRGLLAWLRLAHHPMSPKNGLSRIHRSTQRSESCINAREKSKTLLQVRRMPSMREESSSSSTARKARNVTASRRRGRGHEAGPNLREEAVRRAALGEIFRILTNGVVRRGTPAWSKLPEPQRWQILSFLSESR